jgi:hypothetical protein
MNFEIEASTTNRILTLEQAKKMMEKNGGSLYLRGTGITSLPENLTVGGSLYLRGTGITSLPENLTVGGSLYLEGCTGITSLPENLTVGGSLYLEGCTGITALPENLTVNGYLDLRCTGTTSLPENLTVGGYLDLRGTGITSLPENLTVGGSLDLEGCTGITSLPENLTVGGSLDLEGCTGITSLPENLTVNGYLDLRCTGITSLPENLTVGGSLDLRGTGITNRKHRALKNGDFVPGRYLYADNILTHVKSKRTLNGYTFYQGKIKGKNVVSDGTHYAHCKTLREGIADILFKTAADRGADQYRKMALDSEIRAEEAITMYRIITGACRQGTAAFVEGLGKLKEKYTVREMIDLTAGQYGSERFKEFFEKK